MSPRSRKLILVSLVAAAVCAALLCVGLLLYRRLGLAAALGVFGAAVLTGILATASYQWAMLDWRRNRRV